MTIRLPPDRKTGILDKVLKIFGKERQLVIPKDVHEYGPYVIVQAHWEGFWRCLLLRRRKAEDQKSVEEILAEVEGKNIRM